MSAAMTPWSALERTKLAGMIRAWLVATVLAVALMGCQNARDVEFHVNYLVLRDRGLRDRGLQL
jgi:hypothetical protein